MAGVYKALRVPVALLHQRVYTTSHRLEKYEPLVIPEKKETKVTAITVQPARVISPRAVIPKDPTNLFEKDAYLRRFFFLLDDAFKVECRVCGGHCATDMDRSEHVRCYYPASQTLKRLVEDKVCTVCEQPIDKVQVGLEYHGIPVCGADCMYVWDRFNPEAFEFEMKLVFEVLEDQPGSWKQKVFGTDGV